MKSKVHNGLVHWPVKATPAELVCPCRSLVLGGGADKALVLVEGDVRGQGAAAISVHGDDLDGVVLPDAEARVLGAEIDADNGGVGDGVE